jgi:hypothetical protein
VRYGFPGYFANQRVGRPQASLAAPSVSQFIPNRHATPRYRVGSFASRLYWFGPDGLCVTPPQMVSFDKRAMPRLRLWRRTVVSLLLGSLHSNLPAAGRWLGRRGTLSCLVATSKIMPPQVHVPQDRDNRRRLLLGYRTGFTEVVQRRRHAPHLS